MIDLVFGPDDDEPEEFPSKADQRSFAAFGQVFYQFAQMEVAIDEAVGKILRINETQAHIIVVQFQFNKKLKILRSVSSKVDDRRLTRPFSCTISDIQELSETRNVLAHQEFDAIREGIVVRMRGRDTVVTESIYSFDRMEGLCDMASSCALEVRDFADATDGRSMHELLDAILERLADGDAPLPVAAYSHRRDDIGSQDS